MTLCFFVYVGQSEVQCDEAFRRIFLISNYFLNIQSVKRVKMYPLSALMLNNSQRVRSAKLRLWMSSKLVSAFTNGKMCLIFRFSLPLPLPLYFPLDIPLSIFHDILDISETIKSFRVNIWQHQFRCLKALRLGVEGQTKIHPQIQSWKLLIVRYFQLSQSQMFVRNRTSEGKSIFTLIHQHESTHISLSWLH